MRLITKASKADYAYINKTSSRDRANKLTTMAESGRTKRPASAVCSPPAQSPTRPPPPPAEEDEEERVEEFYALVESIKAMSEVWKANEANKRPRRDTSEPSWIPKFESEDFEEVGKIENNPANEAKGKKNEEIVEDKGSGSILDLNIAL